MSRRVQRLSVANAMLHIKSVLFYVTWGNKIDVYSWLEYYVQTEKSFLLFVELA